MGWDDNGLPDRAPGAELLRRPVRPVAAVRPALRRHGARRGPRTRSPVAISRPNFIELCEHLTAEDEKAYESLFRRLGLSVDWTQTYTTIGETARRASQRAFLRLLERGLAYQAEAPTMWDVDFQTAVAQAEIEDREQEGQYHRIALRPRRRRTGGDRNLAPGAAPRVRGAGGPSRRRPVPGPRGRIGTARRCSVRRCPWRRIRLADPEKGTGVAMICTFGDVTDVTWWRELDLPDTRGDPQGRDHRPRTLRRARMGFTGSRGRQRRDGRVRRQGREAGSSPDRGAARGRRERWPESRRRSAIR